MLYIFEKKSRERGILASLLMSRSYARNTPHLSKGIRLLDNIIVCPLAYPLK